MKQLILAILSSGVSTTKRPLKELVEYLYLLEYILCEEYVGGTTHLVHTNGNPFWSQENNQNRTELIHDVQDMYGPSMTRGSYFRIVNRFENGDGYGIVREGYGSEERQA